MRFSRLEQVHLRDAEIVLQAHTFSNIVTVDGIRIKEGIFKGMLEDRKLNYQWPHPQPWQKVYGRVMKQMANFVCIRTSILTKKLGAFIDTDRSQEFLFQWDPTSDQLVDLLESVMVEHKNEQKRWEMIPLRFGKRRMECHLQ